MAHVVLSEAKSGEQEGESKRPRQGIKDSSKQNREEAVAQQRERVELERRKARDGDIAKKRLRVLAASQAKQRGWSEQQTMDALDQINKMSPEQALCNLDLHLAKAEAGFADKMAISIRDGIGALLDRLFRANGCIATRFRSDHALQSALTDELGYAATFVSNKAVIALSAASDLVGGYQDSVLEARISKEENKEMEDKFFPAPPPFVQETGEKEKKKKEKRKKQCLKIQVPDQAIESQALQSPTPSSPLKVSS